MDSVQFAELELEEFETALKEAEKAVDKLFLPASRKTLIEAANAGLVNGLRRYFRQREQLPSRKDGFPWFGQSYPKSYFWYGTRGTSVAERIRITLSSPTRLVGQVTIASPALARMTAENPQPIRPKGGRRYLAIPASPLAANWSGMPRDFPGGLRFAYSRTPDGNWLPSLVAASNVKRAGKGVGGVVAGGKKGSGTVAYWLVHKVNPRRDRTAMPSIHEQKAFARDAVAVAVKRILSAP
ncbi:MAG: hypothetical protein IJ173_01100 [Kiritimatiellae bacterium]|nr:hypothetical protein [Kiritimatiellia bacterium]